MGDVNDLKPNDPLDREPYDEQGLYYRSLGKTIHVHTEADGDVSLEDALNNRATKEHTHEATDIIEDPTHRFLTDHERQLIKDNAQYYSNDTPIYVEHGGVKEGMIFEGKTITEMFNLILYPYKAPIVSATLTAPYNGGVFEIGTTITVTDVRVSITKKSNPITKITISHGNTEDLIYTDGVEKGGTFNLKFGTPITTDTTFVVKVYDDTGGVVSVNLNKFTFVRPIYHGPLDTDANPTATQITSLSKHIEVKGTKTYNYTCNNERMIFAYNSSYGKLSQILDANGFEVSNTFTMCNVQVPCLDGNEVTYYVYYNNRSTVTNFPMKFVW